MDYRIPFCFVVLCTILLSSADAAWTTARNDEGSCNAGAQKTGEIFTQSWAVRRSENEDLSFACIFLKQKNRGPQGGVTGATHVQTDGKTMTAKGDWGAKGPETTGPCEGEGDCSGKVHGEFMTDGEKFGFCRFQKDVKTCVVKIVPVTESVTDIGNTLKQIEELLPVTKNPGAAKAIPWATKLKNDAAAVAAEADANVAAETASQEAKAKKKVDKEAAAQANKAAVSHQKKATDKLARGVGNKFMFRRYKKHGKHHNGKRLRF